MPLGALGMDLLASAFIVLCYKVMTAEALAQGTWTQLPLHQWRPSTELPAFLHASTMVHALARMQNLHALPQLLRPRMAMPALHRLATLPATCLWATSAACMGVR